MSKIDKLAFADELTGKVGATNRLAFRRSFDDNTQGIKQACEQHVDRVAEWPLLVRDVFASLHDDDGFEQLPEEEIDGFAHAALSALESQPALPQLRAASQCHRTIAARSATKLSTAVADAMRLGTVQPDEDASQSPQKVQDMLDFLRANVADDGARGEMEARHRQVQATAQALRDMLHANLETNVRTSASFGRCVQAIANEAKQSAEAVSMLRGFGLDGSGEDGDDGIDGELLSMLEGNSMLLDVLKECGRMREAASADGMKDTNEGRCDVVGVRTGSDIGTMTPSERARLACDATSPDVMRRLYDGSVLCWEMRGEDTANDGDLVIAVDRSGSMSGAPMVWARALAAASLLGALKARKRVALLLFDGKTEVVAVDGKRGLKPALKALGRRAGGGTNIVNALAQVKAASANLRDPDVLVVSDGIFSLDGFDKTNLGASRLLGVFINQQRPAGVDEYFDDSWDVSVSSTGQGLGDAVQILKTISKGKSK